MASDFNPLSLVSSPITGLFNAWGASKEASAQEQAAQLQYQTAQDALNFAKQTQASAVQQATPYFQLGQQAVAQLPSVVRPTPSYGPPVPYSTQPGATAPMTGSYPTPTSLSGMASPTRISAPGTSNPAAGMNTTMPVGAPTMAPTPQTTSPVGSQMVLMQAPDGTRQSVPQAQVAFYQSRGATVV